MRYLRLFGSVWLISILTLIIYIGTQQLRRVKHENPQCIRGAFYEHMHVSRVVAPLTFRGQDSGILTRHPDTPARFASIFHMLKSSVCESHSSFAPRHAVLASDASCYKPVKLLPGSGHKYKKNTKIIVKSNRKLYILKIVLSFKKIVHLPTFLFSLSLLHK